jgi:hypothetical protein
MNCHKCKAKGKLVSFNTFEYYYCNSCKIEIEPTEPPPVKYRAPMGQDGTSATPNGFIYYVPVTKSGSCLTHFENHDEWLIQKSWD